MANNSTSNGMGFGTVLFLIFLTLKLTNTIDWSWWWIFSPLWIPLLIVGLVGLGMIAYYKNNNKKSYYTDFFNRGK
jgi:ABC-type polysaccharide/polyol phosphate export permease